MVRGLKFLRAKEWPVATETGLVAELRRELVTRLDVSWSGVMSGSLGCWS